MCAQINKCNKRLLKLKFYGEVGAVWLVSFGLLDSSYEPLFMGFYVGTNSYFSGRHVLSVFSTIKTRLLLWTRWLNLVTPLRARG